jgi:hypothetical protein
MLTGFYGAFSPACLALLGLWLVVVQVRMREWQGSGAGVVFSIVRRPESGCDGRP